jgi:hypothetical protein
MQRRNDRRRKYCRSCCPYCFNAHAFPPQFWTVTRRP